MSESQKGWKPAGVAFCWQPKAALRRIREALDAENAVASGLLVYVALTEIASDKQSETFQTTHSFIAMRSGLSQRTVQQRIQDLTDIGVLKCVVPSLRAPASYTLLLIESTDERKPLRSVTQPNPNDKQPLRSVTQRTKNAPLHTLEESPEESEKNQGKKPPAISPAQQRIEWEKELTRIRGDLKELGSLSDHDKGSRKYNRIVELMNRQTELRKQLGVIA